MRSIEPGISRFRVWSFGPSRNDTFQKTGGRGCSFKQPQPPMVPGLLAVADAIDRTGPVVGNEDRAVLGEHDIGGTAEITLIAFKPAGSEDFLLGILAVGPDDHALDARALVFMPVPGAVFGDEDVVLVLGRELAAGIELHAERRDVGAQFGHGRR